MSKHLLSGYGVLGIASFFLLLAMPAAAQLDICGDSEPDAGEECDDGNTAGGDGCSATCTIEVGFSCTDAIPGEPSFCAENVNVSGRVWQDDNGNGVQDGAEPGLVNINVGLFDYFNFPPVITTTNAAGDYVFENVPTAIPPNFGEYAIFVAPADGGIPELIDDWFQLGNLPPGWIPTADPNGVADPYEANVVVTNAGLIDQDFGFQPAQRITTRKITDPPRGDSFVTITSGPNAQTRFPALNADFTPPVPGSGLTGMLAEADPLDACGSVADLTSKIAVIERGTCGFATKVMNAKDAGAVGAVVFNVAGQEDLITMGGTPVELPAVFVGNSSGQALLAAAEETASLTQDDLVFDFTASFGTFQVRATSEYTPPDIEPGPQYVIENVPVGWTLESASCFVSDGTGTEVSPDSIVLGDGGLAICTFLNTPVPDADNDGVDDGVDQCPGTVIPESVPTVKLRRYNWALTDGDFEFDTKGRRYPASGFTTTDTRGCSCEQIIAESDYSNWFKRKQRKYGCSVKVMLLWTGNQ